MVPGTAADALLAVECAALGVHVTTSAVEYPDACMGMYAVRNVAKGNYSGTNRGQCSFRTCAVLLCDFVLWTLIVCTKILLLQWCGTLAVHVGRVTGPRLWMIR